jgi:hypothetical protein
MAAFDDAGIKYELVTDELGWAWVEWDDTDPATAAAYGRIIDELYPPVAIDPIEGCTLVDTPIAVDEPAPDGTVVTTDVAPVDVAPVDPNRDVDVDAMASGFDGAAVTYEVVGEAPWRSVIFDLDNDAAVPVIAAILAGRD